MLEHDEEGNIVKDRVMKGVTPDDAAFRGYMSVFEVPGPRALFSLKGTQHR